MAPAPGTLHAMVGRSLKTLRVYYAKAQEAVQSRVARSTTQTQTQIQPVYAYNPRQPIHPAAFLKQSKSRWFSTYRSVNAGPTVRNYGTSAPRGPKVLRADFPKSRVASAINAFSGRAPFASTLRPNLTGGTLGRTAGGYCAGAGRMGGARYFSHTPAAPAQVVQNVSQALRAFFISGQKAQFDGVDPASGEKRYKSVSALQQSANEKMKNAIPRSTPGSFVDFKVNPTITALTPLASVTGYSTASFPSKALNLNTDGLLDVLSTDFSRALKDLAAILTDLKRLSALGDLPITYRAENLCIRIHFPGCDADTVEGLCAELNVQRGVVGQDADFDAFVGTEIALLFPFAPSKTVSECSFFAKPPEQRRVAADKIDWRVRSPSEASDAEYSTLSDAGLGFDAVAEEDVEGNPWVSSPSGYESLRTSDLESEAGKEMPLEYRTYEDMLNFLEDRR
ncbi:hypothetical protein K402DRAFT_398856 [Aulographum hederae CBS 113979]|uniref:Casein kinase II beta 2 subunit n=1 Tax=Aulographum hederae CBS 113979 TaxID=1176131 RepID=A0A6G1GJK4_9PEZI|nr:hypothetical protein K402DRAFT_398856 [Aulographum hederae CBS 113979]